MTHDQKQIWLIGVTAESAEIARAIAAGFTSDRLVKAKAYSKFRLRI